MLPAFRTKALLTFDPSGSIQDEFPYYDDPNLELEDPDEGSISQEYVCIDKDLQQGFPRLVTCIDHTLSLCVKDGCEKDPQFLALEKGVLDLVNKFKHSGAATEDLKRICGLSLQNAPRTRWLYFFLVAQRLLKCRRAVENVAGTRKWVINFSWGALEELAAFLEPFFKAIQKLEASKSCTGSLVVPTIMMLKIKCAKAMVGGIFTLAASSVDNEIKQRLDRFLDPGCAKYDPLYLMAAYVNPNTAVRLGSHFNNAANAFRGIVQATAAAAGDAGLEEVTSLSGDDDGRAGETVPSTASDDLFGGLPVRDLPTNTSGNPKALWSLELRQYVSFLDGYGPSQQLDPAKYWMLDGHYKVWEGKP